jgi:RNA polymerase sigma-70 factor (ECF subfamily)
MSDSSDGILVEAVLAGDTARFAEVVARHDRRVRAVIAGRGVRDAADVEDLVQKAFYLAFRGLGRLSSGEKLEAWLVRIASRCAIEHLRKARARRSRVEAPHSRPNEKAPAAPSVPAWIWEEVDALDAPLREILRLRYERGLSYAEIAREIASPVSTVRGRLYEARRALRRRLRDG